MTNEEILKKAARYVISNIEDWQAENPAEWDGHELLSDLEHQVMQANKYVLMKALQGEDPFSQKEG